MIRNSRWGISVCLQAGGKQKGLKGLGLESVCPRGGTDSFMSSLRYFTRVWTHLYFPSHRYRTREAWTGICSPRGFHIMIMIMRHLLLKAGTQFSNHWQTTHIGSGNLQLAPLPPRASLKSEPVGKRKSALKSREPLQAEVSSRTCEQEGVSPEVQGSSPGRGLVTDLWAGGSHP